MTKETKYQVDARYTKVGWSKMLETDSLEKANNFAEFRRLDGTKVEMRIVKIVSEKRIVKTFPVK